MKNPIIQTIDGILSFILVVIMLCLWVLLIHIGIAILKLARIVSIICAKSVIHLGKVYDSYEYAKETVDSLNRRLCNECGESFGELLTEMFKVEA